MRSEWRRAERGSCGKAAGKESSPSLGSTPRFYGVVLCNWLPPWIGLAEHRVTICIDQFMMHFEQCELGGGLDIHVHFARNVS